MWNTIQSYFGESPSCVFRYDWPTSLISTVFSNVITNAAVGLAALVERAVNLCPGQPINLVGYSHGGNVIGAYTNLPGAPSIANVVTMGTPVQLYDLGGAVLQQFAMNRERVDQFCTISDGRDMVQFLGASVEQIVYAMTAYSNFVNNEILAAQAMLAGDETLASYYTIIAAGWYLNAQATVLSTRVSLLADSNYLANSAFHFPVSRDAHSQVRTPALWNSASKASNWGCRPKP
jgi:hypothetical protein